MLRVLHCFQAFCLFLQLANLLLLLLLLYAFYLEKEAIRQLFRKDRKGILFKSPSFQQFPERLVPNIALILIGLTVLVSFLDNIVLNILTTTALLLFTINLFQRKDYIFADKILIFLFLMISSITVNGMLINKMIAKGFYVVFLLIPMGILIYLFRLVYWKFSEKNVQDRQNQVKEGWGVVIGTMTKALWKGGIWPHLIFRWNPVRHQ